MSRPTEQANATASLEYAEALQAQPTKEEGATPKQPIEQDDGVTRIEALCE
jgi:hypothetical protein